MKKFRVFLLIFLLFTLLFGIKSYSKYIIENELIIATISIDEVKPKIELIETINSNEKYPNYANKTHTITSKIKVTEKNIANNNINNNIKILVNEEEISNQNYIIKEFSKKYNYIIYELVINNLQGDGNLKINLAKDTVTDIGGNTNDEITFDTGIIVDNTSPIISFEQSVLEEGKVLAKLTSNEEIQNIDAWELSNDKKILEKQFECNATYPLKIYDYAQNYSEPMVNLNKATNIQIKYGVVNEGNKMSFGKGNGDPAGKEIIQNNLSNKTELITFFAKGAIEKDFIGVQGYVYTYWGENVRGRCYTYETAYNFGYNPSKDTYYTLKNGNLINLEGDYTLIIGGTNMNGAGNRGSGGEPIPKDISKQHLFGVSKLKMKLKDNSYYSIVYQVWTKEQGWTQAKENEQEAGLSEDKPMGGYRVSLVPKTEAKYLIDFWNKDIGTNNIK